MENDAGQGVRRLCWRCRPDRNSVEDVVAEAHELLEVVVPQVDDNSLDLVDGTPVVRSEKAFKARSVVKELDIWRYTLKTGRTAA